MIKNSQMVLKEPGKFSAKKGNSSITVLVICGGNFGISFFKLYVVCVNKEANALLASCDKMGKVS